MTSVDAAVAAIESGQIVLLPTDTVYGLAATAFRPAGRDALYRVKGRDERQPSALVTASVDRLLEVVPGLGERFEAIARLLLPGPFTLVFPNPHGLFSWLCGANPSALGVRVPVLTGEARVVLERVEAVVATSANLPGGPEPRRLTDVPLELQDAVAAVLDGGDLPGTPSTVLDLTADEPRVLRRGAGDVAAALRLIADL